MKKKRHLEGDIAIMITTARLANNYFGLEFQIPHLYSELLGLCEENISTFESNQFENNVADIIYTDIVTTTREKYPHNESLYLTKLYNGFVLISTVSFIYERYFESYQSFI